MIRSFGIDLGCQLTPYNVPCCKTCSKELSFDSGHGPGTCCKVKTCCKLIIFSSSKIQLIWWIMPDDLVDGASCLFHGSCLMIWWIMSEGRLKLHRI